MTDTKFIEQMREALRQQEAQAELATKNKLHDAKVHEIEGPKKWLALKACVMESVGRINAGFPSPVLTYGEDSESFTIHNRAANRVVKATFSSASASISYQGSAAQGNFQPHVTANELEFSSQTIVPSRGGMNVPAQMIGSVVTIEKMAELLIRSVVSP